MPKLELMQVWHPPIGLTRAWLPRSWRSRAVVIAVLAIVYIALLYGLAHTRAPRSNTNGVPWLTAVISEAGVRRGDTLSARPPAGTLEDDSIPPARHWIFSPIDIWPSEAGWSASVSGFTPVSDARADPRDVQTPIQTGRPGEKPRRNRSTLRMVRWLRPAYPPDLALAGVQGTVVLDLLIDPDGKPVKITVVQGSGSPELDKAASGAANFWRFAPPRWNSRPVEVWGRVEVRFHQR